mgnify:CR=1 FL=1
MKKEIKNFQIHENGRNQAVLDFYRGVKENPYKNLSRILEDIIEKYNWMPEYYKDSNVVAMEYVRGFFGELNYMKWMAEENKLKVNEDILAKI